MDGQTALILAGIFGFGIGVPASLALVAAFVRNRRFSE